MSIPSTPSSPPRVEIPERYAHDDHRRIFLDLDHVRQWDTGIFQYFTKPEKVPVTGLDPGPPGSWDTRLTEISGSVLIEDGVWRMWALSMPDVSSHDEATDHCLTCYFESEDGLHWRKPDLGLTGQHRWPGNNLLPLPGGLMGVVPALPDSSYRYLALTVLIGPFDADITNNQGYEYNGPGSYLWTSDDGFHWRQHTRRPLVIHGDCACLFADPATHRYFLYQKTGMQHGLMMRRAWLGMESADGEHWEGYEGLATWRECFKADDYDDLIAAQHGLLKADTYQLCCRRVGDLYVAAETVLLMGSPLRLGFGQSPNGLCYIRLAYSHNGFNWHYPPGRPAWLELGRPGEPDAGFMVTANTWVDYGDEIYLYYYGARQQHGYGIRPDFSVDPDVPLEDCRGMGRILLARQKRDRFASLGAPWRGVFEVENTTCMEQTSGRRHLVAGPRGGDALFVNAVTRGDGTVRVALYEHNGTTPLEGFSLDDCVPFRGDAIRGEVRYRRASVDQIPADLGLRLQFEVCRGEVYGYEWGSPRG